jgi:nicotinate-nucleotide pyrophosphorylase (carboxylating)
VDGSGPPSGNGDEGLRRAVHRAVRRALTEDLGTDGDVTSAATVPHLRQGAAEIAARATGVIAGTDAVRETYTQVDERITVGFDVSDGDEVEPGDVVGTVTGPLRSILTGERTALNLLCHLSGVATATSVYVAAVSGTGCAVRDTRKTRPGLRLLEKAAVLSGGGQNHRVGLYDALLVKDNHIAAVGDVEEAVRAATEAARGLPVQVEVTDLEEAHRAVAAGATDLLLDNLDPDAVRGIVSELGSRARLEASGRITLREARAYAETGVDAISIGAITHSAPWLDLGLDVVEVRDRAREGSDGAVTGGSDAAES